MKTLLLPVVGLLLAAPVRADCDAPGLTFPRDPSTIHGFEVTRLRDDAAVARAAGGRDLVIRFGDDRYSIVRQSGDSAPQKVEVDRQATTAKLLDNLVSGPFYLGGEEQSFEILAVEGFDLNGDREADLLFFDVSPGANVYTGVIGVLGRQWVTLVEPTCH